MSGENRQKTMAELLAEFRKAHPEDIAEAQESGVAAADTDAADAFGSAGRASAVQTSTIAPTAAVHSEEPDDDEEVNAEWLELISGMYV